jgi:hypothetical protein
MAAHRNLDRRRVCLCGVGFTKWASKAFAIDGRGSAVAPDYGGVQRIARARIRDEKSNHSLLNKEGFVIRYAKM